MPAEAPEFIDEVAELDPAFGEPFDAVYEEVFSDGALSVKTKLLIMMALDAGRSQSDGVEIVAQQARDAGASEEEILETIEVAGLVCGVQGLATGSSALSEDG